MSKEQRNPKAGPFKADIPSLTAHAIVETNSNGDSEYSDSVIIRLPDSCFQVNIGEDFGDLDYQYYYTIPNPKSCEHCDFCTGNDKQEYVTFSVPEDTYEILRRYGEIHEEIGELYRELDRKVHIEYIGDDELIKTRRKYFEAKNEKSRLREELDVIFTLPELPKLQ